MRGNIVSYRFEFEQSLVFYTVWKGLASIFNKPYQKIIITHSIKMSYGKFVDPSIRPFR